MTAEVLWSLVVPLKPLRSAKTRLAGAVSPAGRALLALAFASDTVAAALACAAVADVTVVTDDPEAAVELAGRGALVVPDSPRGGLNAALAHGARVVRARRPGAPVAALGADLPALRPVELGAVLAAAAPRRRAFLADADGVGTTLLAAAGGVELAPAFGGPSRGGHLASGARELRLAGVESVRRDVDTAANLRAALALGVGPRTARAVRAVGADRGEGAYRAVRGRSAASPG
ncbi:2-phospho-L-lactate guanylyltransferase [Streptomyces polyrhachis]|uniref:Phosphoenolpyruvate guanylyltransferase n=1 Tax=Streptomyces polyrhachis TaxID=1282885 RepID=A0ABW2GJT9_9ACTN